jgi:hypothetical protein
MRISKIVALGALAVGASLAAAPKAQAAFIATIEQVGADVVVTGSGTIDLAGLAFLTTNDSVSGIIPDQGAFGIGVPGGSPTAIYTGFSGPTSFGSGAGQHPSDSGSGDKVALEAGHLAIPSGYVSGSALSDSSTYDNTTLASLGATPGAYTWTWGNGANADSLTVQIGPAPTGAPEPASLALLGTGLAALGLNRRRRKGA